MEKKIEIPTTSHGVRFSFTSRQISQFSNNSLNKTQYISRLHQTHIESLKQETSKISKAKQHRQTLRTRLAQLKTDQDAYRAKVQEAEEDLKKMNKAAVIIQKRVRGVLLRKKIDDEWFAMKKKKLDELVIEIENSHSHYIFSTGQMPKIAAIVLQRAVRRHFFYKKILRIRKVYLHVLEMKEQETFGLIRRVLTNLYWVRFVNDLKFERFREKRLAAIKRKLGLLGIKKVFAREKMSWKIVRIRIRKFKRNMKVVPKRAVGRRSTMVEGDLKTLVKKVSIDTKLEIVVKKSESPQRSPENTDRALNTEGNKEEIKTKAETTVVEQEKPEKINEEAKEIDPEVNPTNEETLLSVADPVLQLSNSQETIVTTTTEKEAQVQAELLKKLEEERKVKVALGRISYGVREKDEKRWLPYLKTFAGIEPDFTSSPTATLSTFTTIPTLKEKKAQNAEKKAQNPENKPKRKHLTGSYMKMTQAFQNSRLELDDHYDYDLPQPPIKVRNNSTLMAPTAAFIQKTQGNPSARSHSTETKTAEKMIIVSKKFRSNILLEIPEQPEKPQSPRKIPVLLSSKPQAPVKNEPQIEETNFSQRVSISFTEALPEFFAFLTQYTKSPRKPKLDPIPVKSNKVQIIEALGL